LILPSSDIQPNAPDWTSTPASKLAFISSSQEAA
jgi:hypothetical protein